MNRDALCTEGLAVFGYLNEVGIVAPACIAYGSKFIDVNTFSVVSLLGYIFSTFNFLNKLEKKKL